VAGVTAPEAKRVSRVETLHGERRVDEYFWLRDREDPDVKRYLESENAYAAEQMQETLPLQEALYREMLGRIQETDADVPYPRDGFFYYSRTEAGKQYPIHCRRQGAPTAPEQVTLDLNELARGKPFLSLGVYATSDDGRRLAYSIDEIGYRQYTLYVKDLEAGEPLERVAERVGSAAWAADNRTLFYTVEDEHTKRQHRLYRHEPGAVDTLVYEEPDEAFNVGVARSRSRVFLGLEIRSHTTAETRVLRADDPLGAWVLIAPRIQDQEYDVDHHGGFFFIRTNDRGRNFRLVKAPLATPGREHWDEVVAHRADVMLEGMDFFAEHYVLTEREQGLPQLRVVELRGGVAHRIVFPEPAYSVVPAQNAEFETRWFRYTYQSLTTPLSVFDYDVGTRAASLLKETEVKGGYERGRYVTERRWAEAPDGATVPLSLVYKKDAPRDGSGPALLHGYGSYGFPFPITFSSNRVSLLDRGFVIALAHVRGGGEMGKPWHDSGRMRHKRNTFTDFIACAEHLVANRYTRPERLVIEGASAGGLLVGAVVNMRPELFHAAVSRVPFVDVINTMLDETLPLTVGEFEEWGNPKHKDDYDYMLSYSPYDNLEPKAYPALLVRTSWSDSQVMYWEPAKYVAKLRRLGTAVRPLLLKTDLSAGHGGASGRYDALRETAFDYAFILKQVGLTG
jgi:oligopeptidase B